MLCCIIERWRRSCSLYVYVFLWRWQLWKIYVVVVKLQKKNNQTEFAKKVCIDMFLKKIMKNWTKNVTGQKFHTVFLNMFELNNKFFTTVDEIQMSQNIEKLMIIKHNINRTQVLDTQLSFPFLKKVIIGGFYFERY